MKMKEKEEEEEEEKQAGSAPIINEPPPPLPIPSFPWREREKNGNYISEPGGKRLMHVGVSVSETPPSRQGCRLPIERGLRSIRRGEDRRGALVAPPVLPSPLSLLFPPL